ncbi:MAG: SLBB domain-containing protein [Ignavibacteriae bacterium]|nr:SLBB domain-containing protein [Ignavibacteriota bacterium]
MEVTKTTTSNNMDTKKMRNKLFLIILFGLLPFFVSNFQAQSLSNSDMSSSSLEALNLINVTIGGSFPMSGTYPASRTERVDQLITRILEQYKAELFKVTQDEKILTLIKTNIDGIAKRNIMLKRFSGETVKIDLQKFRATGDFINNPYLKNDDVLIFPTPDLDKNFIDISGAVNKECKFQFVQGDKLSDALLFAQGINKAYPKIERIEISRLNFDGNKENIIVVNENEEFNLMAGDRIRVISDNTYRRDYKVLIVGEVNNPGYISISKDSTTIKVAIKKAGGFTSQASLKFSELMRENDSYSTLRKQSVMQTFENPNTIIDLKLKLLQLQKLDELEILRNANLQIRDTLYFNIDNKLRMLEKNYQLNFEELKDDNSFTSKFILNDGDIIIVPKETNEVFVWGGVKKTGYYEFIKEYNVFDYINNAGGYTDIAYGDDEVYLIKGKSCDWLKVDDDHTFNIEAGDYIYIKKERPTEEFWYYLGRIGAVAGIFGGLATIYLAFK